MASNTAAQHLDFLRGLIARPKNVGAIAPSSPALSRAIAREIDPTVSGPVLELGPGTGVVTEALIERGIAPERITAIEYDPVSRAFLAEALRRLGCAADVVEDGDAASLAAGSSPYDALILDQHLPGLHGEQVLRELTLHHREELRSAAPALIAALRRVTGKATQRPAKRAAAKPRARAEAER